jgi:hypothetical protein
MDRLNQTSKICPIRPCSENLNYTYICSKQRSPAQTSAGPWLPWFMDPPRNVKELPNEVIVTRPLTVHDHFHPDRMRFDCDAA